MKKKFLVIDYFEDDEPLFETEKEVEEHLEKLSCAYGRNDNFLVLLNGKIYARGKYDKNTGYKLKDYKVSQKNTEAKQ